MSGAKGKLHCYNQQNKTSKEWAVIKRCSREYMAKLISTKGIKGAMEHEFTQRRRAHDVMVTIPASSLDFGRPGWNCNNKCGKGSPPKEELTPIGNEGGACPKLDRGGIIAIVEYTEENVFLATESQEVIRPTLSNVIRRGLERRLIKCQQTGRAAMAEFCFNFCQINGCEVRS